MKRILASVGLIACILAGPALAQTRAGPETTIKGGGIPPLGEPPPSTRNSVDSTGAISESGQRKPPGAALGEGSGTRPDLERKSREIDRRIRSEICRGC